MMLPAIAELYSVTVDEILRGERTVKNDISESFSKKSEQRAKCIIEKATAKFTNLSIISIVSGVAALLLAYTVGDIIYNFNLIWIGYVIILLLVSASVIVISVAVNNLLSSLKNDELVEKGILDKTKEKCAKNISVVAFLTVTALIGLIINIVISGASFLIVALPVVAIIGYIASYFIRSFLYKKFGIEAMVISPEQQKYRKKHVKITSIIITVIVIISVISPFIVVSVENAFYEERFCFADGVGYQYDTPEDAEREYYKLKNFVTDNGKLYIITYEEYNEGADTYTLHLEELVYNFEETKNGYNLVSETVEVSTMTFNSYEETEKFRKEYCYIYDEPTIGLLQKNITFDDGTLTVKYRYDQNYLSQVFDILPVFILIGAFVCVAVFVVSLVSYHKNKAKQRKA